MKPSISPGKPQFDPSSGTWLVQDNDLVEQALLSPDLHVRPASEPIPEALAGTTSANIFGTMARWNDGETHAVRREIVESLIASFELDAVADAAQRASASLTFSAADVHQWMIGVSPYTLGPTIGIADSSLAGLAADVGTFARGISPGADLSQITSAIEASDRLWSLLSPFGTSDLAIANLIGLFFQGYDSMAGLLGNALLFMHDHPDVSDAHIVIRRVMHESPSIRNTRRFAVRQTPLGETTLATGSALVLDLEAATRAGGPSLAFGAGPHQCPGQMIAFTIATAALEAGPRLSHLPASGVRWLPYPNARIPDLTGIAIERSAP